MFSARGEVEDCHLVTDRDTGRSRGFAFVEMSDSDAANVIQALNGQDIDGRTLGERGASAPGARRRWGAAAPDRR